MDKKEIVRRIKMGVRRMAFGSRDTVLIWDNAFKEAPVAVLEDNGKPLMIETEEKIIDKEVIVVSKKVDLQYPQYNVQFKLDNKASFNGYEIY